jgi:hypothetical protein
MLRVVLLIMEAVNTFETSVNFYETTRRSISKDSHLDALCLEILQSHVFI